MAIFDPNIFDPNIFDTGVVVRVIRKPRDYAQTQYLPAIPRKR